jgi:cell division protein FtsI/penicillin-binding protein 2
MAKRQQYRRLATLMVLLTVAFGGLGYRLVDLQVLRHGELSVKAQANTQREFLLEPRRGDILDARGNLLATSTFVKTVCADPKFIGTNQVLVARVLSPLLQIPEAQLIPSLAPRWCVGANGEVLTNQLVRYVPLKQQVPEETWVRIQAAMTNLTLGVDEKSLSKSNRLALRVALQGLREKAIFARSEQMREYPNKNLAAHVLGCTRILEREIEEQPVREITGTEGVECTFNSQLAGVRGWRVTETDHQKHELVALREQDVEPRDGLNVVLTIDSFLQNIVETALAEAMEKHNPISISGIVIRPRTGEVLALATLPNFDPNHPGLKGDEAHRNRVISDIAEPGSTFKIVVVSGALNEGTVRLSDTFDCEHGHFFFAGRTLHDHESYGVLSVENIITKSSNIGAAKIGIQMGENRLYDYVRRFGFGSATGVPLPAELSARVYVPPFKPPRKIAIAQIPMGQGICVTRLQMTMAMCAIANNGWLMRPMLVERLEDRQHNVAAKYSPQRVRQVITEATAHQMVQALKTVVSPEGTAPKARLERYTVAGKTGTAQKVEEGHYVHKYFSSFVGFFPADDPELCISVTLDEPKQGYYGGQTAAPVFKQIAEQAATYLNIKPDEGQAPALAEPAPGSVVNHSLKKALVLPQ